MLTMSGLLRSGLFKKNPPPARGSFESKIGGARAGYPLRGGRGGRGRGAAGGGSIRSRGEGGGSSSSKAPPKSSEDLDAELDKFMGVSCFSLFALTLLLVPLPLQKLTSLACIVIQNDVEMS